MPHQSDLLKQHDDAPGACRCRESVPGAPTAAAGSGLHCSSLQRWLCSGQAHTAEVGVGPHLGAPSPAGFGPRSLVLRFDRMSGLCAMKNSHKAVGIQPAPYRLALTMHSRDSTFTARAGASGSSSGHLMQAAVCWGGAPPPAAGAAWAHGQTGAPRPRCRDPQGTGCAARRHGAGAPPVQPRRWQIGLAWQPLPRTRPRGPAPDEAQAGAGKQQRLSCDPAQGWRHGAVRLGVRRQTQQQRHGPPSPKAGPPVRTRPPLPAGCPRWRAGCQRCPALRAPEANRGQERGGQRRGGGIKPGGPPAGAQPKAPPWNLLDPCHPPAPMTFISSPRER